MVVGGRLGGSILCIIRRNSQSWGYGAAQVLGDRAWLLHLA